MGNKIYDYEQVQEQLKEIVSRSGGAIVKQKDLGQTGCDFPIEHYTIGRGKKELVISGAMHGNEIITVNDVLEILKTFADNDAVKKNFLNEYTIHVIPVLNPEGYIISTSAIRTKIPRDMDEEEAEKIAKEYYLAYRADDQEAMQRRKEGKEPDHINMKKHQAMFADADWNCIPELNESYKKLREKVKTLFEKYNLPEGCLVDWSANGDGIDPQANTKLNSRVKDVEAGNIVWGTNRFENLIISKPGATGCPSDPERGFEQINEVKALYKILGRVAKRGNLAGFLNLHSTMGAIYQRPAQNTDEIKISQSDRWKITMNNYMQTLSYRERTVRGYDKENNVIPYMIQNGEGKPTSVNDVIRMVYPGDLLIELSGMGGNPIGPFGDRDNYNRTIGSNVTAFVNYLHEFKTVERLTKSIARFTAHARDEFIKADGEKGEIFYDAANRKYISEQNRKSEEERDVTAVENDLYSFMELFYKEYLEHKENGTLKEMWELIDPGFERESKIRERFMSDDIEERRKEEEEKEKEEEEEKRRKYLEELDEDVRKRLNEKDEAGRKRNTKAPDDDMDR